MSAKLVIVDSDYVYRIQWSFDDDDDYGATLGERRYNDSDAQTCKPEDWEHVVATIVAGRSSGVRRDGSAGYSWDSRSEASAALKAIKIALKAKAGKPWPSWALTAKAEGWSPPKGWTP